MKPENILVASDGSENPGDWNFKLADLGISNFKYQKPARQNSADNHVVITRTFGRQSSVKIHTLY